MQWMLPQDTFTPWSKRVWAFVIDWAPIWAAIALPFLALSATDGPGCAFALYSSGQGYECMTDTASFWIVFQVLGLWPAAAVYFFWNFCYRQGRKGQSIGKSAMKFWVLSEKTWQPIGFWRSFARQLAHYADQAICYVGFFLPLWDSRRQTLADKALSTVCVPWREPPPPVAAQPQVY